jgi:ketosteroid isomerase-like protein
MSGMTIYVTLPGFYKEPITVPTTATIADFCREVHKKTGVTLFNGFGFVSQASDGTITQRYVVPTAARIVNQIPETYDGYR